ncbi:MAG: peptide chain release factor 1 [Flavobacteriales bacterium]|nr:peptide chain release factor 1 [Flavobacteriales bacterium]
MLYKLEGVKEHFIEVGKLIVDPDIISDMKRYVKLTKEYKDLEVIVQTYDEYKNTIENITSSKEMLANETDAEFKEMAKMEIDELSKKQEALEDKIKVLLIPKDEEDAKNAVMEIRAGTGGDEASIFVGDLFRMYSKYCDKKGWKIEIVDTSHGTSGGYKEIVFNISGADVYGILKYESGVHRVQRVPQTETQGRVHTSAVAIIVLPEAEEFDIEVKDSDLKVDSFCSSGPGGQSVNTTYSAIRITHLPTGVVAQCQDQKSKLKNYDKALSVLRSRIYEIELQKKLEADAEQRKNLVSSSDRSAKIRTYNYSQGRVTDHRINLTLYNLSGIIDGDVDEVIQPLRAHDNAEKLKFSEAV